MLIISLQRTKMILLILR